MLHMMRNMAFLDNNSRAPGRALVPQFTAALDARLPRGWRLTARREPRKGRGWTPDALIQIRSPQGTAGTLVLEAKARIEPKDIPALIEQLRAYDKGVPLIAAPFLSRQTIERLKQADLSYIDATGNARIVLNRPGLFIDTMGADRDPRREERPARSLKGAKAGRIVRALCDFRPPFGVRDLASRSNTNAGYVSRVLDLLERGDLIKRQPRKPITFVDWQGLIRQWARDYSPLVMSKRTSVPLRPREFQSYLEPRGLSAFLQKLQNTGSTGLDMSYAITGSLAASRIAPVTAPTLAICYVDVPSLMATRLDLKPADAGANVLLATPFDPVVYDRTWSRDGVTFAALSQVAADLLTSPDRGPSEADALIAWMGQHEDAWRS